MRHELKDLYAELGPLLAFDASSEQRWATRTFDDFVGQGSDADAEAGWCTWLACDGVRQFHGTVEVLVEEPPPGHAQYAETHVDNLWLRLPTGALVLAGCTSVLPEKERSGDTFRHELKVAPGDYTVEAWSYVSHESRLEDEELPGDPPPSGWRWVVRPLEVLAVLATLIGLIGLVPSFLSSDWPMLGRIVGLLAVIWAFVVLVRRATGETKRERQRAENRKRALAQLPSIPDFTLLLRRVEEPPARGGGLLDSAPPDAPTDS